VLARVLDATIVRQLVGVVQAPRKEDEEEDEDEDDEDEEGVEEDGRKKKKPVEVRLYDLLQSALGRLGEGEEEEGEDDEDEEGEGNNDNKRKRQARTEAVQTLRQCLGREVERMVDGLLGHVLAYWSERSQAQRSEEGYLAWLRRQRACHTSDPHKGRSLEESGG
jgi:hypothetical protein